MSRQRIGRHEARPGFNTDREQVKRESAERVSSLYRGRHRA